MRFLSIYKNVEKDGPPPPELVAEMGKLIEDSMKKGELLSTEGCLPSAKGARVRLSNGKVTVTDGPFTEAKEVVGGFAILNAKSKEDAIEMAKHFLKVAGDGECEIRQIAEPGDFGPEYTDVLADIEKTQRTYAAPQVQQPRAESR
ncbi:MAG TPA: YciI family protein [Gemmatimonadaceae bacterium]|nr:YciI family protein [Gemmatimonadaceae bacterium]